MDDQQMRNTPKATETTSTSRIGQSSGAPSPDQDRADSGQSGDTIGATMEQARSMARNVGEQARSAVASAGTAAQDLAQRARDMSGADALYQQGARAGEYLTRNVNEYPLAALLVAGMVGYGLAYLVHTQWQGADWSSWTGGDSERRQRQRRADRGRRD